jgi:hypothetical protein
MQTMLKRILVVVVLAVALLAVLFFLFGETRQLTGVVRDAVTSAPIEGALIKISNANAITDGQGQYAVAVSRGKTPLDVSADGYAPQQVTLNGDDLFTHAFAIDVSLMPNQITGTVRDAETNAPLSNARVMVGNKAIAANAQGVFDVRGVKNSTTITTQMPGYLPAAVLFEGQSDLSLVLTPNTTTATVIDKYTSQPVLKAQVQITGTSVTVNQDGRAIIRRVRAGDMIRATATGYESGSATFTGDGDVQIVLRPETLDGIVTDAATGLPISGTTVYLGNTVVQSDAKGAYHFDRVPAKAPLVFKSPGYLKTQIDASGTTRRSVKLAPFLVKAIHIPFGITVDRIHELMDMVYQTELNAIVIDVKSEKGRIAWDSQVPLAKAIGAPVAKGINLTDVIKDCRAQNIYCIARLAVFQDNRLAGAYPDLAIRTIAGSVYADSGGASWANPYNTDVWDYNIALAQEVVALGFDEIQFDYVRFPGRITGVTFGTDYSEETRIAAISGFLARAQKVLRPTGAFVSADVFGLTTATDDDQGTGQRLHDLAQYLDYVSPMVYPDTWVEASDLLSKGLGIRNCTEADLCPYDIVYNSYKRAIEKTSTKVRLWLQAYQGHGNYGVAQYRLQKKAANDTGSYGWMFWSGTGTYDLKIFDPPPQ